MKLARLGRDRGSRLGRPVVAAAVHHCPEGDRRKDDDRDQDRHQRRRTSILFARRGRLNFAAKRLAAPDAAVEVRALATLLAGALAVVLPGASGARRVLCRRPASSGVRARIRGSGGWIVAVVNRAAGYRGWRILVLESAGIRVSEHREAAKCEQSQH